MPAEEEKRVTWAELFFDLVFVFAVTQVTTLLHRDDSLAGTGRALIVFVPVWWAWVGTTIHANRHDVESARETLGIFVVGLGSFAMALAVPGAYGYTRWRMFHKMSWTRVTAAAVCLSLLPVATRVPATALLIAVTVVTVALNVVEALIVRRHGSLPGALRRTQRVSG